MTAAAPARRPGIRSMIILIVCEAKMVARDTAGLIVPIGLPLLILITSASSAGDEEIFEGMTALDLFVLPLVLVVVVATIGIINMPSFLAYYRRSGILRRLAVTPASPMMVLIAQAIVSVLQAAIGVLLALTIAMLAFGAHPPRSPWIALGVVALTVAAMYAVGMIVAAVAPTPNSAVAIGLVAFFALGALGGLFGGRQALPAPLAELGAWLPFGAAVDSLSAAWAGVAVNGGQLLSLGITVVIGLVTAALFFRWE
ncbi:ABC transporter permease [Microbacterium sp. CIAB417]|uniref:ABC transporter permease n=1 Tax=Microbacterium sp. CIAB417 TaxID=2860287 RepID=UPI001FABD902|nr:ABC transporter permease [Microbacterium sp. CIAB417]